MDHDGPGAYQAWGLNKMVAPLGLRTHDLLYEEIGNIIAENLSASE